MTLRPGPILGLKKKSRTFVVGDGAIEEEEEADRFLTLDFEVIGPAEISVDAEENDEDRGTVDDAAEGGFAEKNRLTH